MKKVNGYWVEEYPGEYNPPEVKNGLISDEDLRAQGLSDADIRKRKIEDE